MRNKIGIIPIDFKISGTKIFIPFKAVCSVTDKEFSGKVTVEYHPGDKVLEYVDVEKAVNELSREKTTAEKLTHDIYSIANKSINPRFLRVTTDVNHSNAHRPVQVWIES